MMHRIRKAMTDLASDKLGTDSPIEIDETFVGGKVRNMHKSRRDKRLNYSAGNGKAIVMGMLERGGRVRARVIADRKLQNMRPMLEGNIERGAHVITDEHASYPFLAKENEYAHERGLGGTYMSVEPFHLDRSVDEQVFRFNLRHKHTDAARFKAVLKDVVGRRLTYAELTGRVGPAAQA